MEKFAELSELQKEMIFFSNMCPDCGLLGFLEGPHGGMSVNIRCKACGSEFNVCPPFFAERISPKKTVEHIIFVREYSQTYIASSEGQTASCTAGREQAAAALARKLMGAKPYSLLMFTKNERAYLVIS